MMYCSRCGTDLPEDSAFCHKCGAKAVRVEREDAGRSAVVSTTSPNAAIRRGYCEVCGQELGVNEKMRGLAVHQKCPTPAPEAPPGAVGGERDKTEVRPAAVPPPAQATTAGIRRGYCERCGEELGVNEKMRGVTAHERCPTRARETASQAPDTARGREAPTADPGRAGPSPVESTVRFSGDTWIPKWVEDHRELMARCLEADEPIVAVADCVSWDGQAFLMLPIGLFLWIAIKMFIIAGMVGNLLAPMIGFGVAGIVMIPRWKLIVTDRKILVLAKRRFSFGLSGALTSYRFKELESVEVAFKPFGGNVLTLKLMQGGREVRYYQVTGGQPSKQEFEKAVKNPPDRDRPGMTTRHDLQALNGPFHSEEASASSEPALRVALGVPRGAITPDSAPFQPQSGESAGHASLASDPPSPVAGAHRTRQRPLSQERRWPRWPPILGGGIVGIALMGLYILASNPALVVSEEHGQVSVGLGTAVLVMTILCALVAGLTSGLWANWRGGIHGALAAMLVWGGVQAYGLARIAIENPYQEYTRSHPSVGLLEPSSSYIPSMIIAMVLATVAGALGGLLTERVRMGSGRKQGG